MLIAMDELADATLNFLEKVKTFEAKYPEVLVEDFQYGAYKVTDALQALLYDLENQ